MKPPLQNFNPRILSQFIVIFLLFKICVICSQKVPFSDHYYESKRNVSQNYSPRQWPNQSYTNSRDGTYGNDQWDRRGQSENPNYPYDHRTNNNQSYGDQQQGKYLKEDDYERRNYPDQSINWLSPNPFAPPSTKENTINTDRGDRGQYPPQENQPPYRNNNSDRFNNYNNRKYNNSTYDRSNYNSWNSRENSRDNNSNNDNPNFRTYNNRQESMSPKDRYYSEENDDNRNRFRQNQSTRGRDYSGQGRRPFDNLNVNPADHESSSNKNKNGEAENNPQLDITSKSERDPKRFQNDRSSSGYPEVGPDSKYRNEHNPLRDNSGRPYVTPNRGNPNYHYTYPVTRGNFVPPYPNPAYGDPSRTPYPGPVNPYPGRNNFNPGDPNRNVWNEHWTTTTYRPTAPGVLGRWRPELQGQQRPEDFNTVPETVYVDTTYGKVQGFKVKLYDGPGVPLPARPGIVNVDKMKHKIASFVGIPYARAPKLEGRFRPPRSHPGWTIWQAVDHGPACPQPTRFYGYTAGIIEVDEDCLYLNVYSPDVGSGVEGSPFPVIFYIHDGDFIHGASHQFPPHQLVAWHKVVVVTVNFRLGSLGFLSTADEFSPGNYGMLDLAKALKWVNQNIRSFNGDSERITLVGLGSGAAAAGLLMLSPRTRHYVKNVVALEGAPTADWGAIFDRYRLQNTTELYSFKLGCWQEYDTTSWKMVQCLRSRSWQELANLELDPDVGTFPWSPAVDKEFRFPVDDFYNDWKEEDWHFLPDTPYNLLKAGDYPYVKYMTGFSRQSAADLLHNNKTLAPRYEVTRDWFDQMINLWVKKYNYTLNPEGVFRAIRYGYTYYPDPMNTTHLREQYIDFLSDALYRAPVDETVKLLLAGGIQVHMYLLNYTLEGMRLPFWREVPRGLEYYLLSGAPFMDPEFYPERLRIERSAWTEGDRNMSEFFMAAVANMAHYGIPTPKEILGIYWERATPADLKYLALNGTNNSTMQRNYRQRELMFWTEYMPMLVGRFVPTYPPTTEYWWEPTEPLVVAFWSVSGLCLLLIVALVACFLLWRTTKHQRDKFYRDYGPDNGPFPLSSIPDDMSDYADTIKTVDSMGSAMRFNGTQPGVSMKPTPHDPLIHNYSRVKDAYPTKKRYKEREIRLEGGSESHTTV